MSVRQQPSNQGPTHGAHAVNQWSSGPPSIGTAVGQGAFATKQFYGAQPVHTMRATAHSASVDTHSMMVHAGQAMQTVSTTMAGATQYNRAQVSPAVARGTDISKGALASINEHLHAVNRSHGPDFARTAANHIIEVAKLASVGVGLHESLRRTVGAYTYTSRDVPMHDATLKVVHNLIAVNGGSVDAVNMQASASAVSIAHMSSRALDGATFVAP